MELPTRRLALFFVVISGVLGLYVLCVSLQIQVPWHMMTFDTFRPLSTRTPEVYNGRNSLLVDASEVTTIKESPLKVTKRPTTHPKRPTTTTTTTTTTTKTTTTTTTVSPTKPDFFGDRYASDNVPLQTSCPDSIRTKVPLSSFANKFLGTIPVLQWAKSVSMAEYQRLKNYPGAHGWGGLGYPLIQSTLSVLNSTANRVMCDDWEQRPNRTQCIRCAVVGNGGILKDSKKGLEIDQHDYVFRTNGAVIKGFEQDVGSRTSFYTFSTNTMRNSIRSYAGQGYNGPPISEETRYVFLPDHNRDYILMRASALHLPIESGPERTKTPPKYFGANASVGKFKMYHPDFVRYLRNRFLRSSILNGRYKNIYRPSTGATMLLAALHSCDQVSAYGFMTPNYKNFSDHYYDKQYHGVAFYANHDFRLEMRLWQELHQAGLLNLYMRP